jgi:hypothetical protein
MFYPGGRVVPDRFLWPCLQGSCSFVPKILLSREPWISCRHTGLPELHRLMIHNGGRPVSTSDIFFGQCRCTCVACNGLIVNSKAVAYVSVTCQGELIENVRRSLPWSFVFNFKQASWPQTQSSILS